MTKRIPQVGCLSEEDVILPENALSQSRQQAQQELQKSKIQAEEGLKQFEMRKQVYSDPMTEQSPVDLATGCKPSPIAEVEVVDLKAEKAERKDQGEETHAPGSGCACEGTEIKYNPERLKKQKEEDLSSVDSLQEKIPKSLAPWLSRGDHFPYIAQNVTIPRGASDDPIRQLRRAREKLRELSVGLPEPQKVSSDAASYAEPFIKFITGNPTVYHAVANVCSELQDHDFKPLSERDNWNDCLEQGGKYYVKRNDSSVIGFTVGEEYQPGNGASIIATHIDALAARLKPISSLPHRDGFVQLGIAPYAGGLNATWWDRDLGIGGRVIVRDGKTGAISTRLVKLDWPIARIPTLAPHFGQASRLDGANRETEMVPIIGVDNSDLFSISGSQPPAAESETFPCNPTAFTKSQPSLLVSTIASHLDLNSSDEILNWDLELFDTQPGTLGGLNRDLIFAGRIDDKLCSWSAIRALLSASPAHSPKTLNIVACFDDEEIGSLLRQGAHGNFLPTVIQRINSALGDPTPTTLSQTYANSFLISADVSHAVNPNFQGVYLPNHSPRLNVGVAIQADSNGHTTTDAVSSAFLQRVAELSGQRLQVFQIRNDVRSGGTVGPMLSAKMGVRAIDAGLPQLSMHSIRATTGKLDPGLGVLLFRGFFENFEEVDGEFREGEGRK